MKMKTLKQKHAQLSDLLGEPEAKRRLHGFYDRAIRAAKKTVGLDAAPPSFDSQVTSILADLTERTGVKYRTTTSTKAAIRARMNDGFALDDFYHVHQIKALQWLDKPDMRGYLHPSTLYREKHFEKYLNEWQLWHTAKQSTALRTTAPSPSQPKSEDKERKMTPEEAAEARAAVQNLLQKLGKKRIK
jgi:uncharacterized phage protein (TIGR02220 family)